MTDPRWPWSAFPLNGALTSIGPPTLVEYDLITALRNRSATRRWFFDSQLLDIEVNRAWLAAQTNQTASQVLTIRSHDSTFLGFIGWSNYRGPGAPILLGRIALHAGAYRALARRLGTTPRVADDASRLLIDYAFEVLRVSVVETHVIETNRSSAALCRRVGLSESVRPQCASVTAGLRPTMVFQLTRGEWSAARASQAEGVGG